MIEQSVAARVRRGLGLVDRVQAHDDLYVVNGETGNYTICLTHQTYGETCSCPDWRVNVLERGNLDHRCKHIIAATIYNARNCRRGAKIIRH